MESLDAPKLKGIETADFVAFQRERSVYERRVSEKSAELGVSVPLTSYRNSIEDPILRMLVTAQWVSASSIDTVTESQLKQCIKERSKVEPADYDLAQIERNIRNLKLEKSRNLEMQVWKLGLRYATALDQMGYAEFISARPHLAVEHILKRISHDQLRKRMNLTYKLRKEESKQDYDLFLRELAMEAKAFDRHEAAISTAPGGDGSDSDPGALNKNADKQARRNKRKGNRSYPMATNARPSSSGNAKGSLVDSLKKGEKRRRPSCLNPKCNEHHWLYECPITSDEQRKELTAAYHAQKKARAKSSKGNDGNVGQLSRHDRNENSSLFSGTFCDGTVHVDVLADQGSDVNLMPPETLEDMMRHDPHVQAEVLDRTYYYRTVDKGAPSLPCSRMVKANLTLNVRHASSLLMRGMEWMISDRPVQHVTISRHVLQRIGLDNRKLLAAACDRYKGIINVPELLSAKRSTDGSDEGQTSPEAIYSLLQQDFELGSTFHSDAGTEDDKLADSNVYIDIGEDSEEDLDAALADRVVDASRNGLSKAGTEKLSAIIQRNRSVFD